MEVSEFPCFVDQPVRLYIQRNYPPTLRLYFHVKCSLLLHTLQPKTKRHKVTKILPSGSTNWRPSECSGTSLDGVVKSRADELGQSSLIRATTLGPPWDAFNADEDFVSQPGRAVECPCAMPRMKPTVSTTKRVRLRPNALRFLGCAQVLHHDLGWRQIPKV